jgi:hypothetical protein
MSQFLGFSRGIDGVIPSSGTYSGVNVQCSGSAGSNTLTCDGVFTGGDLILVTQFRGSGVGNWEIVQVLTDNGGTLTLASPLVNTYSSSGDNRAQAIEIKEYLGATITGAFTCNAWNDSVGGILPIFWSGRLVNSASGNIHVNAKGYRGGDGVARLISGHPRTGFSGESYNNNKNSTGGGDAGADTGGIVSPIAGAAAVNGAGGAGRGSRGEDGASGGAGAGHSSAGTNGQAKGSSAPTYPGGSGGGVYGTDALTTIFPGSGGGSGGNDSSLTPGNNAGSGGGIIFLFGHEFINLGLLASNGDNGGIGIDGSAGGAGAGSGGSIIIKVMRGQLSGTIQCLGGVGGAAAPTSPARYSGGGNGGLGRVRFESCSSLGGGSNPAPSISVGGKSYCGSGVQII